MNQFKEINEGVFIGPQPTEQDLHMQGGRGSRQSSIFGCPQKRRRQTRR